MIEFLIWFVICFLSTLGFSIFYYKISKSTQKITLSTILIFIVGVFISTITRFCNVGILNSICYFIYYPCLYYFLNPFNLKNIPFYLSIIWLYGMILDFISMMLVSGLYVILNINVENVILFQGLPTILVSFLFIIFSNFKFVFKGTKYFYNLYLKIEYLDLFLISFVILMFILGISISVNIYSLSITFLLTIIVILFILFLLLIIKYKFTSYENKIFLDTLKENNEFYIEMDAENRIFKHNLSAKLLSIKSVSNKKSRKLIDDILFQFNKNVDFSLHIRNIPYGFNGIIYQKLYPYLDNLDIKFDTEIDYDIFRVLKPKRYNVFVEKMVIALDNAIESSLKSAEKLLVINLYSDNSEIVMEIKNSFDSNLNVDNLGTLNYSTKGNKRGLGLFSILRDKEASVKFKIINDFFVTKISAKEKLQNREQSKKK